MKKWQSDREDYLTDEHKQESIKGCLIASLFIILALVSSWALIVTVINNQLTK